MAVPAALFFASLRHDTILKIYVLVVSWFPAEPLIFSSVLLTQQTKIRQRNIRCNIMKDKQCKNTQRVGVSTTDRR